MIKHFPMFVVTTLIFGALLGAGILTSRTIAQAPPTPGSVTYRYDSLGRIVQDIYPANSAAYSYDAVGNRTAFTQN